MIRTSVIHNPTSDFTFLNTPPSSFRTTTLGGTPTQKTSSLVFILTNRLIRIAKVVVHPDLFTFRTNVDANCQTRSLQTKWSTNATTITIITRSITTTTITTITIFIQVGGALRPRRIRPSLPRSPNASFAVSRVF